MSGPYAPATTEDDHESLRRAVRRLRNEPRDVEHLGATLARIAAENA